MPRELGQCVSYLVRPDKDIPSGCIGEVLAALPNFNPLSTLSFSTRHSLSLEKHGVFMLIILFFKCLTRVPSSSRITLCFVCWRLLLSFASGKYINELFSSYAAMSL